MFRKLSSLLAVSLLSLAACGPSSDLAGFPDPRLGVNVSEQGDEFHVSVALRHSAMGDDACPTLAGHPDVEIDGVALETVFEGGSDRGFDGNVICQVPTWATADDNLVPTARETSTLRIEDSSLAIEVQIDELFAERTFVLDGGVLTPGQQATVRSSVATDTLVIPDYMNAEDALVRFVPDDDTLDAAAFSLQAADLTIDGSEVRFTVPADLPAATGNLEVTLHSEPGHTLTGVDSASFQLPAILWLETEIAP